MNAFSLVKVLTLVVFMVVGQAHAQAPDIAEIEEMAQTKSACEAQVETDKRTEVETLCKSMKNRTAGPDGKIVVSDANDIDIYRCISDRISTLQKEKCGDNLTAKDMKTSCAAAVKEYTDANVKGKAACNAFEKTASARSKDTCGDNMANCRKKMDALFSAGNTGSDGASATEMMTQLAMNGIRQSMGLTAEQAAAQSDTVQCVKDPDPKERRLADEKRRDKISQLEKDIRKEADDQAKALKKQREKSDDLKKEINKIEADAKKELLSKDSKKRDKTAEIRKSTLETAKRLRGYQLAISQENQKLAVERLKFQKASLALSKDKINLKCQQEFEALKSGIIKAATGGTALPPDLKQFEALVSQCKGQLNCNKKMEGVLNIAIKSCFENANTQIAELSLQNNQAMETINRRIDELKSNIDDEKKSADNNNLAVAEMEKGIAEEITAEEREKLAKLSQINEELMNFATSTNEEIAISRANANKLTLEIQNLKLKKDVELTTVFDEAETLIDTAQQKRLTAMNECRCGETSRKKGEDNSCSRLRVEAVNTKAKAKTTREVKKR